MTTAVVTNNLPVSTSTTPAAVFIPQEPGICGRIWNGILDFLQWIGYIFTCGCRRERTIIQLHNEFPTARTLEPTLPLARLVRDFQMNGGTIHSVKFDLERGEVRGNVDRLSCLDRRKIFTICKCGTGLSQLARHALVTNPNISEARVARPHGAINSIDAVILPSAELETQAANVARMGDVESTHFQTALTQFGGYQHMPDGPLFTDGQGNRIPRSPRVGEGHENLDRNLDILRHENRELRLNVGVFDSIRRSRHWTGEDYYRNRILERGAIVFAFNQGVQGALARVNEIADRYHLSADKVVIIAIESDSPSAGGARNIQKFLRCMDTLQNAVF